MEKLWSQILVLCSMKMELCTQILALTIMEKLWSQILVLDLDLLVVLGLDLLVVLLLAYLCLGLSWLPGKKEVLSLRATSSVVKFPPLWCYFTYRGSNLPKCQNHRHIRRVDAGPGPLGRIGHALAVWPECEAKNP